MVYMDPLIREKLAKDFIPLIVKLIEMISQEEIEICGSRASVC